MITRKYSILDQTSELEHLHTFKNVPASMACTSQNESQDVSMDQVWDICKNTGMIQLRNLFPLDVVYKFAHNDAVGIDWEIHNKRFMELIHDTGVKNILEIGSGSGKLGKLFLSKSDGQWTGLEPNHDYAEVDIPNFIHSREWFDDQYKFNEQYDAVVHSNVFEHTYDPIQFLKNVHSEMSDNALHIFSIPNLYKSLDEKFTNQLNFEHTAFLTEEIVDILLKQTGFNIVTKHYNKGLPAIFYVCKKVQPQVVTFPKTIYDKNKKVFFNFVEFYKQEIDRLNKKINEFDGEVYLFGAHIFSQFLIYNGLNIDRIKCILDNSTMKQNNRLYGTDFIVNSPKILEGQTNIAVILKAAQYNTEIKEDIISNINSNVIFWE